MNTPRFAKLLARWFSELEPTRAPDPDALARSVATVERALALRRKRRQWRKLGLAMAAAACALGGAVLVVSGWGEPEARGAESLVATSVGRGAWLSEPNGGRALDGASALSAGSRLSTATEGGAELVFRTGTRVRVDANSSLEVLRDDAEQRLALRSGGLYARVAKLAPGERFLVELPSAEVEVRGTAFQLVVHPGCASGSHAHVRVDEGVVEVRTGSKTLRLAAGESWRAGCEPEVDTSSAAAPPATSALGAASLSPRILGPKILGPKILGPKTVGPVSLGPVSPSATQMGAMPMSGVSHPAPSAPASALPAEAVGASPDAPHEPERLRKGSSLAEQNALFAAAVAARQRGDVALALSTFAQVAERFPNSALTENALLARVRLLAQRDVSSARNEALRFVRRYPNSFARHEVEALLESE